MTVQPIREKRDIEKLKFWFAKNPKSRKAPMRDYMLFLLQCNFALRISDMLRLTVGDVRGKDYVTGVTKKTGAPFRIPIHDALRPEIDAYTKDMRDGDALFPSRKGSSPITPTQAYRIIKEAAASVGIKYNVGTHSPRKTFGYTAYRATDNNIAVVQHRLAQKNAASTLSYIGVTDDEADRVLKGVVV